jgi:hypothetical protein
MRRGGLVATLGDDRVYLTVDEAVRSPGRTRSARALAPCVGPFAESVRIRFAKSWMTEQGGISFQLPSGA